MEVGLIDTFYYLCTRKSTNNIRKIIMAEAKNVTFDSIMADLKARKFVPLYYLMGDEPY